MYTIDIKQVKVLIRDELEGKVSNLLDNYHGEQTFVRAMISTMLDEFNAADTPCALDTFMIKYYRWTVQEWIETL